MKTQNQFVAAFLTAASLMSATVAAEEKSARFAEVFDVQNYLTFGYALGGDNVGELKYEDGSSSDVSSGAGLSLGGGLELQHFEKPFGVELSVVYKFDAATAENADVSFDRFEISAIPYYNINDKARFGLGVSQHMGVEFSAEMDGVGSTEVEFDSGTALVAQLMFKQSEELHWGLKATSITYTADQVEDISGTNVGIFMNYKLR